MHDCTGACSHGRTNHHAVVVDVRIHDVDAGQGAVSRNSGFERLKREGRGGPIGLFGPRDPLDVRARDHAEHAEIRPPEGGDIGGMVLRGVTRGDDHVVERDEHAPTRGLRIGRDANGVEKIEGPLGRKRRGGTHRAREHDGLFALHHQIEEERGLLHRVGAVRNHDARDVLAAKSLLNRLRELHPDFRSHRARVDVRDLGGLDVGHVGQHRNGREQVLDAEPLNAVARHLRGGRARTDDGAARGENHDLGCAMRHGVSFVFCLEDGFVCFFNDPNSIHRRRTKKALPPPAKGPFPPLNSRQGLISLP